MARQSSLLSEPTLESVPGITPAYRRYALLILLLVYASSHVDRQILAILLEPIKHDLVLSDTQLGFLSGIAFAIFYATLGIPIAMWADRSNRRNIIALALATWSGMTVLCGLAANFLQLALARIGVGVGEAGSSPPSHSMIADMYPPAERGTAMGVFAAGANLGLLIGFLVGGWINQWYGWRMAFYVVGAPGLVLAVIVRLSLCGAQPLPCSGLCRWGVYRSQFCDESGFGPRPHAVGGVGPAAIYSEHHRPGLWAANDWRGQRSAPAHLWHRVAALCPARGVADQRLGGVSLLYGRPAATGRLGPG